MIYLFQNILKENQLISLLKLFPYSMKNQQLYNYKEVKFLCYIIGGYVLNKYIEIMGKEILVQLFMIGVLKKEFG